MERTEHVEFAVDDGVFVDERRKENVASLVLNATSSHLNEVLTAAGHCTVLGHLLLHLHSSVVRPCSGLENLGFLEKVVRFLGFLGFLGFRFFRFQCTKTGHKIMTQKFTKISHT